MAEIILFISVFLIILLVLVQDISFTLYYDENLKFEIDYSFIRLVLKKGQKIKSPKKRKKSSKKFSPLDIIPPIKTALDYVIERSTLKISKLHYKTKNLPPDKFSVRYKNVFTLISLLAAYLDRKAKKLIIEDNALILISDGENKTDLDADFTMSCPLYVILVGAALFFQKYLKQKIVKKAKLKNKMKRG